MEFIRKSSNRVTTFNDLKCGDCFVYSEKLFCKTIHAITVPNVSCNAFSFGSQALCHFDSDTAVELVKQLEVHVYDYKGVSV